MKALEAARIMNGDVNDMSGNLVFTGVSTDTRTIKNGDMFIAIKGENFDGSDYIYKAFDKGASCAVSQRMINDPRVIMVQDSVKALGELAKNHREHINAPVIAVTGSVGKTTVKNMLISVLSCKFNVHYTKGNKNNHIGLPMTLMELTDNHDISVLEMGMSGFGEIDYLSYIAQPDYAIITNIGMSHIGMLGSKENILVAKSEIMNHMKSGGTLLINGDDELLARINKRDDLRILSFGTGKESDCIISGIRINSRGNCEFESDGSEFKLPVPGAHNAINAAAVIAIARMLGLSDNIIRTGLSDFKQSKMRMHRFEKDGILYINDAYNANPQSMKAALDILGGFEGRKIAVLGDMLEMGGFSKDEHIKLGAYAAKSADLLIFCGQEAENMHIGAGSDSKAKLFISSDEAGIYLAGIVKPGDTVLVKGSRGMKMENVLEYIKDGGNK